MKILPLIGFTLVMTTTCHAAVASVAPANWPADLVTSVDVDIPATRFVLDNGLTLIVHEDRSAPLVAVNIWYHVGSKNEPAGRSGFAHLFEHLMFNGSENFNDDFYRATQKIGATQQNGTTNADRTNYFQTVPTASLDTILWLESDRMGHLLGAIDQTKLDEQRAVVKNELRQNYENRPYGIAAGLITAATAPAGHPYDHLTIGSMTDLDEASLDDVKNWFRAYYGASNAVIVLAGDISPGEAKAKVEKYFGDIAPGEPVTQPRRWVVPIPEPIREVAYDRVAQPRLYKVWNVAEAASPDADYLQLLGEILTGDRNARLIKRLVVDDQLVTSVSAGLDSRELGGQFLVMADVRPGADIRRVEAIIDEELARLLDNGIAAGELARVRTKAVSGFVRANETVAYKAAQLAESEVFLGDPAAWKKGFLRTRDATPAQVQDAARRWLTRGDYILHILPFGRPRAAAQGADRSRVPPPGSPAGAVFPSVERATLPNGLKLVVARKQDVPIVNLSMLVKTGTPADYRDVAPGTGRFAMSLLDEGTASRTADEIADSLALLGANLSTSGGGETSTVSLSALRPTLSKALSIYSDIVMNPAFPETELGRSKANSLANLASSRLDVGSIASRLLPSLAYGADSAYGRLVTEAGISAIKRSDLQAFHGRWFHPNNATLVITGDITMHEALPMIKKAFGGWAAGAVPATITPTADAPSAPVIYLVDRPGAAQSRVQAAFIAPPRLEGDELARDAFNSAFGGKFISRLNLKLREEKGWSYGAHSWIDGGKGARLFVASSSVQADKTAESLREMALLLGEVGSTKPIEEAELDAAKTSMSLSLATSWSTGRGIASYLGDEIAAGLPIDYYANYPALVAAIDIDEVREEACSLVRGRAPVWLVVGDRGRIEPGLRALGIGKVVTVDADGMAVN